MKFRITKFTFLSLLSIHWAACFVRYSCACLCSNASDSWTCRLVTLIEGEPTKNWIYAYHGTMDVAAADVYNVAVYFVVMTGTSVGYGDVSLSTI